MPKTKLATISGVQVQANAGTFSILGRDSAGNEIEVELPMSAMNRLAAETRRAALVEMTSKGQALEERGKWGEVVALEARSARVGRLHAPGAPTVALIFDHGEQTELAFRFPPKGAHELGVMLVRESERIARGEKA
jgi:hypothetical protein